MDSAIKLIGKELADQGAGSVGRDYGWNGTMAKKTIKRRAESISWKIKVRALWKTVGTDREATSSRKLQA
mgnify:CR=1 FL=1